MCKHSLNIDNFPFEKKSFLQKNLLINNRYYIHYKKNVCLDLIYKQNLKNTFEIPKIEKITLNATYKTIAHDKKFIIPALSSLMLISGETSKWTIAHKSIAGFKLRKNQIIGCKTDLRKLSMYNFLEKLITIVLPRVKHFKTIDSNKQNHISIGIPEIVVFFELENYFEFFQLLKGLDITVFTAFKKTPNSRFYKLSKSSTSVFLSAFQIPIK
jgi:large subunit ribosomal protein L5